MTARGSRTRIGALVDPGGSFEDFYLEHWSALVAVTGSLCRDLGVAEELSQEAFLRAYRRWSHVATLDRPEFWVRRVALNLAVSRFRRLQAERRAVARTAARDEAAAAWTPPSELLTFWDALRSLPARQGKVAALFYVDDLSVAQIAELLGCAEGTVKSHLHGARQRLRASLESSGEDGR